MIRRRIVAAVIGACLFGALLAVEGALAATPCATTLAESSPAVFFGSPPTLAGRSSALLDAPAGTAVTVDETAHGFDGWLNPVAPTILVYRLVADPSLSIGSPPDEPFTGGYVTPGAVASTPAFESCLRALGGPMSDLPHLPVDVVATPGVATATLTWAPPYTSGVEITGYRVSRNGTDTSGGGAYSKDLPASDRRFQFTLLRPVPYVLSVQALSPGGRGPAELVTVTPTAPPTKPPPTPTPTTPTPTSTPTPTTPTPTSTPPTSTPPAGFNGTFSDDDGNVHEASIQAISTLRVTTGCGPQRFCPSAVVSRAQLASFLDRALALPPTSIDFFSDDAGNVHEGAINRVAAMGVTAGCAADRYCPGDTVSRAQMASLVAKGFRITPAATTSFTDIDGVHAGNIAGLEAARVVSGCAVGRFCPDRQVTRDQMATFLASALR